MSTLKSAALIPVEEYLRTSYRPDCDYVDGEVQERNLGERPHSTMQGEFLFYFRARKAEWRVWAYPEQRIRVAPARFRVPDVCVYTDSHPTERVFRTPPFICIEILSPDDRMSRVQQRIDDYLNFGVPYVWVIDPETRRAWTYSKSGSTEIADSVLRTENPSLEIPLAEIFAALDE